MINGLPIRTMSEVWRNAVGKWPEKTAAVWEDAAYSYSRIDELADHLASNLAGRFGVKKGDRVAILAPNCLEFYVTYWAVMRAGAVLVPVNVRLRPEVVAFVIDNSDPACVICHRDQAQLLEESFETVTRPPRVATIGFSRPDATDFAELLTPAPEPPSQVQVTEQDLAAIVYTSGTTGRPKGALIKHGNLIYNIHNTIISHSFRHEDVHMLVVPLFHCTGLNSIITTSAYLGGTVVIAARPNVAELVSLIERRRITTFLGVPTLFYFVCAMKDLARHDTGSLRVIGYSGSPMPAATIRKLRERFPAALLHNFFGLTETVSITNVLPSPDALTRADSVGPALPDIGMKVIDEAGRDLPPEHVGELCFHRANVIDGYWRRPELLAESMMGDWFRTGDYAYIDRDGYVYLKGRKKDMIIVAGENVYATEVEAVLLQHEKVLEAAVVGIEATGARAYMGELIKAVVVPQPGGPPSEPELRRFCAERLASYQVPQIIEFRQELPRNPSGKVIKGDLK